MRKKNPPVLVDPVDPNPALSRPQLMKLIAKFKRPPEVRWLRTGIHALDLACGGGIPIGRCIEVFGSESAGKSLLAWTIAAVVQRLGGVIILFDLEATAPAEFMRLVGVNVETLIMPQETPRTVEELRESLKDIVSQIRAVDKDVPILAIWDSVAATSANGEWEDLDTYEVKANVGARAKAMSEFFRKFTLYLAKEDITLICVNQIREKIGVLYGKKTDSPGGMGLKFHASMRIELNGGKRVELNGKAVGRVCYASVVKNKCASPFRKAELNIMVNKGYDHHAGLLEILIDSGRVKKEHGGFSIGEKKYKADELAEAVKENPDLLKEWL